jgi:hypothetical protein
MSIRINIRQIYSKLSVVALVGVLMATSAVVLMPAPAAAEQSSSRVLAQANPAQPSAGGTVTGDGQDTASPTLSCEILTSNPINWFVCPVVTALQGSVTALNGAIDAMLTIDIDQLFDARIKLAWAQFRLLAIGLIIIAGLVMIGSQAFGMEILDAYTVRKVLPRLVVAIIFISISWDLLKFLIELSNNAGNSIRGIIYQPFQDLQGAANQGLKLGGWATFVGLLVGGAAIVTLGIAALASFLITAALAVGIGFIVLLLRELIIMLLVIAAPIAIALYILPNTQKAFEFWKNTLLSMLVVFPIISAFIALGRVFAALSYNNGAAEPTVLDQLTAFIAFFLPYFLLPFAFKLAGGVIGNLAGMVNDKGKGVFDGLSNYRSGKRSQNVAAMKAGNRFTGNNPFARGFNRATVGAATGIKGRFGMFERGRQAVDQVRRNSSADLKKTPGFAAISNDDDALMAATYNSASEAKAAMRTRTRAGLERQVANGEMTAAEADTRAMNSANRAVAAVQASTGFGRPQAIAAAEQMVSTGTGYHNMQDLTHTIARASGGDSNTATSLAGFANSETKKVGRNDLAPGFGTLNTLVQNTISGGNKAPSMEHFQDATIAAARGTDNATLVRNKTPGVTNMSRALQGGLQRAQDTANSRDPRVSAADKSAARQRVVEITAKIENMRDSGMYAPETNVETIHANAARSVPVRPEAGNKSYGQHIVSPTVTVYNADPTSNNFKERTNAPNTDFDANAEDVYSSQRNQRGRYDADDPRNNP